MGNWGKVSELLNAKDKTEKACMEHYVDLYLHSFGSILPKVTSGVRGKVFVLACCFGAVLCLCWACGDVWFCLMLWLFVFVLPLWRGRPSSE